MDYLKKIEESIKFSWKYKSLWIFGFIISLFGAGMNFNTQGNWNNQDSEKFTEAGDKFDELFEDGVFIAGFLVFLCIGFVIALIGWYLTSVSKGALIESVRMEEKGQEPAFKPLWKFGRTKAWEFIKLDLIQFLIAVVIGLILLPIILVGTVFPLIFCAFCLAIPLLILGAIAWSLTIMSAHRYIVLKDMHAWESLKAGWNLVRTELADFIISGLIALIPGCIWLMLLFPISIITVVIIVVILAGVFLTSPIVGLIMLGLLIVSFSLLSAVINSPYVVFNYTYWTKIIMELMKREKKD